MNYNFNIDPLLQFQNQQQRYLASLNQKMMQYEQIKPVCNPFLHSSSTMCAPYFDMINQARLQNQLQLQLFQARFSPSLLPPHPMMSVLPKSTLDISKNHLPINQSSVPKVSPADTLIISKDKGFKAQLREILEFVITHIGRISETELTKVREKLSDDKKLLQTFEALVTKYSASVKTKENIIKYVLRKVFKSMKENLMKDKTMDSKSACGAFVDRYFPEFKTEFNQKEFNPEDEEEVFNAIMPFKKNSKNKTMNNNFLVEIFTSESFKNDYNLFVSSLDDCMYADNYQKVERFLVYIQECVDKGAYKEIGKFKRLPWLKLWMEKTKETACDLAYYAKRNTVKRKPRKDSDPAKDCPKKIVKCEETKSEPAL